MAVENCAAFRAREERMEMVSPGAGRCGGSEGRVTRPLTL